MKLVAHSITAVWLALWSSTFVAAVADEKPVDTTLGAKPPEGAVVLFDGKNLEGWVKQDGKSAAEWPIHEGVFTVSRGNIMTRKRFGDFQLHLEFNIPYMPNAHGQGRGNSGVYLTGNHELQVLDSYKLKLQNNDCGAIYTAGHSHRSTPASRRSSGRPMTSPSTRPRSKRGRSSRRPG